MRPVGMLEDASEVQSCVGVPDVESSDSVLSLVLPPVDLHKKQGQARGWRDNGTGTLPSSPSFVVA